MKAAVYHGPGSIKVEEIPLRMLRPGEGLLRVLSCGVCGTDIKTYLRGHPMFNPPCVLGHEPVGEIVELCPGDEELPVAVGDVVAVAPYVPCNGCPLCFKGREELCTRKSGIDGAFSEYVILPREVMRKGALRLPEGLSPTLACLAEPLACCLNAVGVAPIAPGDTALIAGAGPMGLLLLELCKARGAGLLLVSEPNELRRREASRRGAQTVDPSATPDLGAWAREKTGGCGADTAFVCVGTPEAIAPVAEACRPGGTLDLFGGFPQGVQISVDPNLIHYSELGLLGSFGFAPRHFRMAVDLLAAERLPLAELISREFPLDEVGSALDLGASGRALKLVLQIGKGGP